MVTWFDIHGIKSPFDGLTPTQLKALGSEAMFFTEFEIAHWPPISMTPRQLAALQRPGPTPELTSRNRERGLGNALPSLHGDWFNRLVILERAIEAALKDGQIEGFNGRITVQSFVTWLVQLGERPSTVIQALFDALGVIDATHASTKAIQETQQVRRQKRPSWQSVLEYLAQTYKSGAYSNTKAFWRDLKVRADKDDSPFVLGKGSDRDKLVVKETHATLAEHTLENNMGKVRKRAYPNE
ncbi:hypothetical protein [Rhodoferax sp.]|uniref:hypothetical protein n=1 Tax=Rhodoferax sp. TaxID=50421 RepID=UPI0026070C78|nr:hypothetical protein [Rhodoferax sp.]MDD2920234.1 hypothetical protein [Rhodoferax sp.]